MDAEDYTVGAVAELTGVSVRTLHHRLLDSMNNGVSAGDPAVMDLAEQPHRALGGRSVAVRRDRPRVGGAFRGVAGPLDQ